MASVKSTKQVFLKDVTAVGHIHADGTVMARAQQSSATKAPILVNRLAPTTVASGATHTITIAEILTGILSGDPGEASAWTLPTGTLAVAGIDGVQVGDCIDFSVINLDGSANIDITMTAATGATLVGTALVQSADVAADAWCTGSGLFRCRFTNVSDTPAYVCTRIA